MSDATGSDVEDLPEDKTAYANEGSGKESCRETEEVKKIKEIPKTLNPNDFLSKPFLSKKCTVPEDILVFQYPSLHFADITILLRASQCLSNNYVDSAFGVQPCHVLKLLLCFGIYCKSPSIDQDT